ncbi:MAG: glycosyltransferase [Alphaproteobacteria bacterium]
MRVLQVMAGAQHGGAELFFERLTLALGRAGVEQHAMIRTMPARAARLRSAGIATAELRFGGVLDFCTARSIRREIANYRPDVVLSWMSRATQKTPPRIYGDRLPVHCARLGGYYSLRHYRHCDHLIGNTLDIVDYLKAQGWPAARAHYLPNFADAITAPPAPRELFSTPGDAPLLLAMGRLHFNKGFDVLLAAMVQLPGVYLWLGGEGPEEPALRAQAARLQLSGRVRFLGWRDDGPALMAAADVLVCPSRLEPRGNVVIEAWAQGIPVAATRARGPEALIQDGVTGVLADCEDADALASAIRRIAGDRAFSADLIAAGREAYQQNFTQAAVVASYQAFFEKVAA